MQIRQLRIGLSFLLAMAVKPAWADSYALIIGINEYKYSKFDNLKGAVLDAKTINEALRSIAIPKNHIVMLLDDDAHRDSIKSRWHHLIERSKPGDTLIFTFAGHGMQEPDINKDEALRDPVDDQDETLVLGQFNPDNSVSSRERLVDDDLYQWFKAADGRTVIAVIDACHSGDSFRSIDPRAEQFAWKTRFLPLPNDGPLPPTPESQRTAAETDLTGLNDFYFFAASESNKESIEGPIEGSIRGPLSWAFAKALKEANADGNEQLTVSELTNYVTEQVKIATDSRQLTDLRPRSGKEALFHLPANHTKKTQALTPKHQNNAIRLFLKGTSPPWIDHLVHINLTTDNPDIIWDINSGDIIDKQGSITAKNIKTRDQITRVVDRDRLINIVNRLSRHHFVQSQLGAHNEHAKRHRFGEKIMFSISGIKYRKLVQFNIAGNGAIQCFDVESTGSSKRYRFNATAPAGRDTLVTLVMNDPPSELVNLIRRCPAIDRLIEALPRLLQDQPYQLGHIDTFTGDF